MLKKSTAPNPFTEEQINVLNEILDKLPEGELTVCPSDRLNAENFTYKIPSIDMRLIVEAPHPDVKGDPIEGEQMAIYWGSIGQGYGLDGGDGMYAYYNIKQLKQNKNKIVKCVKEKLPIQLPFIRFFDEKATKIGITPKTHSYLEAVEAVLKSEGRTKELNNLKKAKLL